MPAGVRREFLKWMRRFLWSGHADKRCLNKVRWDTVCLRKDCGGAGIGCLKLKNVALLSKWCFRILDGKESLWKQVILSKYQPRQGLQGLECSGTSSTSIWQGILKISKIVFPSGQCILDCFRWRLGNGTKVSFWNGLWCGAIPLAILFPRLYEISLCKDGCVNCVGSFADGRWFWSLLWRRRLYSWETEELDRMIDLITEFCPNQNSEDSLVWSDSMEDFTTKRCYNYLEDVMFPTSDLSIPNVWSKPGAPKWQAFMWLACLEKILSKGFLARIRVIDDVDALCSACGDREEDSNHILLNCNVAWSCWSLVMFKWGFCWVSPRTMAELFVQWAGFEIPSRWKDMWYTVLFSTTWSIWLGRNDRTFNQGNKRAEDLCIEGLVHGIAWAKLNLKGVWMNGLQLLPAGDFVTLLQH